MCEKCRNAAYTPHLPVSPSRFDCVSASPTTPGWYVTHTQACLAAAVRTFIDIINLRVRVVTRSRTQESEH